MNMKKSLLVITLLLSVFLLDSCKKAIQAQEQNLILQAMTQGQWYVQQYLDNGTDITSSFSGINFQFFANGTVNGISVTGTQTGTWVADINSYTISSAFPAVAGLPLTNLNYTWKIQDAYTDYVVASTTTPTGIKILHLRKL
jgi:hypothetical protein